MERLWRVTVYKIRKETTPHIAIHWDVNDKETHKIIDLFELIHLR